MDKKLIDNIENRHIEKLDPHEISNYISSKNKEIISAILSSFKWVTSSPSQKQIDKYINELTFYLKMGYNVKNFKRQFFEMVNGLLGYRKYNNDKYDDRLVFLLKQFDNHDIDEYIDYASTNYGCNNLLYILDYLEHYKINIPKKYKESKYIDKAKALNWLADWVEDSFTKTFLPPGFDKYFFRKSYKTLYRGISWSDSDIKKFLPRLTDRDFSKHRLGDILFINLTHFLTSWTTEFEVADRYAKYNIMGSKDNKFEYGVVLEISNIKKIDVLVDIHETFMNEKGVNYTDHEVVLYPGRFKAKILRIYKNREPQDSMVLDEKFNSI
jgi:hypothetical protein